MKCSSETPLESIPCPILHIRLGITPIKTLIYNQYKPNQTTGYNLRSMELSGGMELVGGGGGLRTQHSDGLSWSPC